MTDDGAPGNDGPVRIPIIEETVRIGKETVETGRVNVASRVIGETSGSSVVPSCSSASASPR